MILVIPHFMVVPRVVPPSPAMKLVFGNDKPSYHPLMMIIRFIPRSPDYDGFVVEKYSMHVN